MYIPLTFEGSQAKCLFASGGYEGYFISGSQQWKYHFFTSSTNLQVQKGTIDNVQIYVIGGAGGGARSTSNVSSAGGGGGGGTNFTMNGRLFQGTYNIVVGRGGAAQLTQNTNGLSGLPSSIIGANLNLVANGGGGGEYGSSFAGGTSGNGFVGGTNTPTTNNGGGGGGATAAGNSSTGVKAGDGGAGNIFYIAEYASGYGCGGGGYAADNGDTQGFSCNDTAYGAGGRGNNPAGDGANYFGMGGGGGGARGAAGGSGSVIIQYPIYDYCSNYFDETGSCGCRELTFDVSDTFNFYPDETGSYIYMPCGGSEFASGTLDAYLPKTFCAVSNSYYTYTAPYGGGAGFINSGPECFSASLTPVPCSPEAFPATCNSTIVTIWPASASVGNPTTFGYVAKNATTHSIYTTTTPEVSYFCISTGSLFEGNQRYPQVLTGNFATLYNTASCSNTEFTASWNGVGSSLAIATITFLQCDGTITTLSVQRNATSGITNRYITGLCVDRTYPVTTNYAVSGPIPTRTVNFGTSCLGNYIDTGSCGCP
jgi:hypothetical protein